MSTKDLIERLNRTPVRATRTTPARPDGIQTPVSRRVLRRRRAPDDTPASPEVDATPAPPPSESPLPQPPPTKPTRPGDTYVAALHDRGLVYPRSWATRFQLAMLAARDLGALVILAGTTGTGKTQIVRQTADVFNGMRAAVVPVRPEWLGAADLLGYVDPIRGMFAPTPFVDAVRDAVTMQANGPDVAPFLLLLDEMNLAKVESFGADLLSVLELPPGNERAIRLFSQGQLQAWTRERDRLDVRSDQLTADQADRLDDLRSMLDGARPDLLPIPSNMVICGTLNTDRHTEQLSPKVLDRGFVLQAPDPKLRDLFEHSPRADTPRTLVLPPAVTADPTSVWASFPTTQKLFLKCAEHLAGCGTTIGRHTVRNAGVFLGYAGQQYERSEADQTELAAGLAHMLLLPRIECRPVDAVAPLQQLHALFTQCSHDADDVVNEVDRLLDRAQTAPHGVLRGLR